MIDVPCVYLFRDYYVCDTVTVYRLLNVLHLMDLRELHPLLLATLE